MLLIDECTDVDFGGTASHIAVLKTDAVKTVSIDATPMGAFFADDSIKPEFVFWLEPNWKKYRGFHDFQVKGVNSSRFLEHDVYSLPKKLQWGKMVKADPNMVPWLDQMSEKGTWTSIGDTRSRVMRLCNTGCIANMDTQFNEIKKRYQGKFAIVEMHKKGTRIYDPTTNETSEFNKNLSLTDAISLFNDPDKFPRILCIVGRMGDRCLSFVSNDYKLHLNEDYLTFPKTTVVGTMYQRMRMCGNNRGMGPLNLYITKSASKDISKGLTSINEMIEYAQKKSCQSMRKSMTTMKMLRSKFSKRKLAASKFKEKVNKVKENDGGWGIDKYVQEIKDENGNVIETVPLIVEKDAAKKNASIKTNAEYIAKRYEEQMNRSMGKIALIINLFMKDGISESLSIDDIEKAAGGELRRDFDRWNPDHGRVNLLVKTTTRKYNLTAAGVEAYEKYHK